MVRVTAQARTGSGFSTDCTGIGARWVITARHCINDEDDALGDKTGLLPPVHLSVRIGTDPHATEALLRQRYTWAMSTKRE